MMLRHVFSRWLRVRDRSIYELDWNFRNEMFKDLFPVEWENTNELFHTWDSDWVLSHFASTLHTTCQSCHCHSVTYNISWWIWSKLQYNSTCIEIFWKVDSSATPLHERTRNIPFVWVPFDTLNDLWVSRDMLLYVLGMLLCLLLRLLLLFVCLTKHTLISLPKYVSSKVKLYCFRSLNSFLIIITHSRFWLV
jgi:hypothetical protein